MADVTVAPQDAVIPYDHLSPDERSRVDTIVQSVHPEDSQAVIQYGVAAQSKIAEFADTVLDEIRSKDGGHAGQVLSDLLVSIKDLNVNSLASESPLSKVPLLGSLVSAARRFVQRYEKLSVQIERIVNELDKARVQLMKDITLLDKLYEKNTQYQRDLDLFIVAGERFLLESREKLIPELQKTAESTKDPMDAQRLQDANQFLVRFEKKLHDLKLSRMITIQSAPQIRLIQNNDQALVEKIQTSILNTIPLWKNQVIIAITLFRQKKALTLQKEVADTTNELLTKNSELLKQSSIDIARESERGIVDIETLQKVNTDLITTIEETLRIQQEGRSKREAAEVELRRMEGELKQKLSAVAS
ncbi:MAG TPA: toxic anion resistance protein [Spirochaetia bacterium]|nr:toxic anion resistance protein [Spirochaetia bacterium]